jgi:hypothetical protein
LLLGGVVCELQVEFPIDGSDLGPGLLKDADQAAERIGESLDLAGGE